MALPLDNFFIGDRYMSKSFGEMEVISNEGSRNVGVRFLDTGNEVFNLQRGNVIRGTVKDIFAPRVVGVGYLGTTRQVARTPAYRCWCHMLTRCYDEKYHSSRETYTDCTVTASWLNFCNFETWFNENYIKGYHLDKDLIIQGNRVYHPQGCSFIPAYLNSLIIEGRSDSGDLIMGVSKRKKKGSQEYNGLYNVQYAGKYLARSSCLDTANNLYKEFKKLHFEELSDKYEELGLITSEQAQCLRTREV